MCLCTDDGQKRAQDSENARRRRENPYLNQKKKKDIVTKPGQVSDEDQKVSLPASNGKQKKFTGKGAKRQDGVRPAQHHKRTKKNSIKE